MIPVISKPFDNYSSIIFYQTTRTKINSKNITFTENGPNDEKKITNSRIERHCRCIGLAAARRERSCEVKLPAASQTRTRLGSALRAALYTPGHDFDGLPGRAKSRVIAHVGQNLRSRQLW